MSRQGTQKQKKEEAEINLDTFTRAPEEQPKKYKKNIKSVDSLAFFIINNPEASTSPRFGFSPIDVAPGGRGHQNGVSTPLVLLILGVRKGILAGGTVNLCSEHGVPVATTPSNDLYLSVQPQNRTSFGEPSLGTTGGCGVGRRGAITPRIGSVAGP